MTDISTTYMGIPLKNPIIVGASELTANMETIKHIEEAGAAAMVIKSLFEEQIQLERLKKEQDLAQFEDLDWEIARNAFAGIDHAGPAEHLMWTRKAKETVSIPIIASLNCIQQETWIDYAAQLEKTGVDGLELNFHTVPTDFKHTAREVEENQLRIMKAVIQNVTIPVSVKLTPFMTNPLSWITKMDQLNIKGIVLFNRLFQPDIDIEKEKHQSTLYLSPPDGHRLPLRYAGLFYGNTQADICANTGIYTGGDVAKMLLAGAQCVQVVSALYKHQINHIGAMLKELTDWMETKGYEKIEDFRGKLSHKNCRDPWMYKRAQYVRMLMRGNPLNSR